MSISSKEIFKKRDVWQEYMSESWDRGERMIAFIEQSKQKTESQGFRPEALTFNVLLPLLRTLQSRARNIDLSLGLLTECDDNSEEKTFRQLLHDIMLNNKNKEAFAANLDKVYSFGQAVFHIKAARESEETLNDVLEIENVEDVTTTFFDKYANEPTFCSGEFCGITFKIASKKLKKYYKALRKEHLPKVCEVADFWVKEKINANYYKLTSGIYKREDLIDPLVDSVLLNEKPKKSWRTVVNYYRAVKDSEIIVEKHKNLKLSRLPLVFNPGGTIWDQENKKYESYPFGHHLTDPQKLLNFLGSIIAHVLKGVSGDKWIFSPEHLQSAVAKRSADEINTRDGGMAFTGNINSIRREMSQQMPQELPQLFSQLQQGIRGMANNLFAENAEELKSMSGVAFDKLFARMDLSQNTFILDHIRAINRVGETLKELIPLYYYQERDICVCQEDGTQKVVKINQTQRQPDGTDVILNNIKNLTTKYKYAIKPSPSKRLQDQNLQIELEKIYKINPQAAAVTIDIYAKTLDTPAATMLAKRLGANIPKPLKDYANGTITETQFNQYQAQQKQQQAQMMMQNPQSKYLQAKTQAEQAKPNIDMYKAQTSRLKEQSISHNKNITSISDAMKVASDNEHRNAQQQLDLIMELIKHLPKMAEEALENDQY